MSVGCTVEGCGKPVLAKGYCSAHYTRAYRHGNVDHLKISQRGKALSWLRENVDHDGDDCLTWPFKPRTKKGYALVNYEGRMHNASAVMCELAHGKKPTPLHEAAHSCGKGHEGCVNPRHLRWATRSENFQDKHLHGTMILGEKHPWTKLTDEQVAEIQSSTLSPGRIAEKFGVSRSYVWELRTGKKRSLPTSK